MAEIVVFFSVKSEHYLPQDSVIFEERPHLAVGNLHPREERGLEPDLLEVKCLLLSALWVPQAHCL